MNREQDKAFSDWAKSRLDEQMETLDGDTLSRLRQIRANAVQEAQLQRRTLWSRGLAFAGVDGGVNGTSWVPAGGLAMLLVVSVLFMQWSGDGISPDILPVMEIIAAEDEIELYENLDFYRWLEAGATDGSA
ncbi:MAG: hypothetical protein OI74_15875 [Gammaproteobacteria bacterium (ex Lamellibrachia satsuma)]|nr:MAG: DUF3619 family protein [Gammaproteobacteria bacterium (ex Lamellibrachia satsuma)]RRS30919.1 MAG: hypothetical protein OI74_15875 [Gammaproteobacteria bacterium (ex Lamellibrachia satsuma)]RRS37157.1 MAG: hypothetical protein NV67_02665 [Gammaproteobacteria bacterium (ex Lamellibrachia satsuma)]